MNSVQAQQYDSHKSTYCISGFVCEVTMGVSTVHSLVDGNQFLIDGGMVADRADGCLLTPQVNDQVLTCIQVAETGTTKATIIQILHRQDTSPACINVPSCEEIHIHQNRLRLSAKEHLSLLSREKLQITATLGALQIKAKEMFNCIANSLIETAKVRVSRAEFTQINSNSLTQFQSNQTVLTADEDVKIDAERIHLG